MKCVPCNAMLAVLLLIPCVDLLASTPAPGVWHFPTNPSTGSGLTIFSQTDRKAMGVLSTTLGVSLYSYRDSGEGVWYLSVGNLIDGVMQGTLDEFTGGVCPTCPLGDPNVVPDSRPVTFTFLSARTGLMQIEGEDEIPIEYLSYGEEVMGFSNELPPYSNNVSRMIGEWVFASTESNGGFLTRANFNASAVIDPPGTASGDFFFVSTDHSFVCIAITLPDQPNYCVLHEDRDLDSPIIATFLTADITGDRMVGYAGEPVMDESGFVIRGEVQVIGSRLSY